MPSTAFALAPALSLRPTALSRARRASRASITIRATSEESVVDKAKGALNSAKDAVR
jgi:hypothetical protein